jgi:hypothetical protein
MSKHSNHTWVVDFIEDGSASIEVDGRSVTPIPAWMLPEGVREGDVLSVTHDKQEGKSALLIETDPDAKRKALDSSAKQHPPKSEKRPRWRCPGSNADRLPACYAVLALCSRCARMPRL